MLTVLIVIVASLALGLPLARWIHIVATGAPSPLDRLFDPVDGLIHRLIGWDSAAPMGWLAFSGFTARGFVRLRISAMTRLSRRTCMVSIPQGACQDASRNDSDA
mgnify:CR=1 FL=1